MPGASSFAGRDGGLAMSVAERPRRASHSPASEITASPPVGHVMRMASGPDPKPPSPWRSSISTAMVQGPFFMIAAGTRYFRPVPMSPMVLAMARPLTKTMSASSIVPSSIRHSLPSHSAGISTFLRYHSMPSKSRRDASLLQTIGIVTTLHASGSFGSPAANHASLAPGSSAFTWLHHAVPASWNRLRAISLSAARSFGEREYQVSIAFRSSATRDA